MWSKKRRKELRDNARAKEIEGKPPPPEASNMPSAKPATVCS